MADWVLTRWNRWGHDRLYAETRDGSRLGYVDMTTHEMHPNNPDDLRLLSAAVATYLSQPRPGRHRARVRIKQAVSAGY